MRSGIIHFFIAGLATLFLWNCGDDGPASALEETDENILVLLTDFSAGSDVAIRMTGAVKDSFPETEIVFIPAKPFNIREAAYQLEVAVNSYPQGSYFVGIVDPGSQSALMVFETGDHKRILVPDNGLASRVISSTTVGAFYSVSDLADLAFEELYTQSMLAVLSGKELCEFGDELADPVLFEIQNPTRTADVIRGEVLFSDNFGNCVTNIPDSLLYGFETGDLLKITLDDGGFLARLGTTYASVPVGRNVAFSNSSRRIELSVNYGSLSGRYAIGAGDRIEIGAGVAQVGILLYIEMVIADSIVADLKAQMASYGLEENRNVVYSLKNAHGDIAVLPDLIGEFADEGVDVIIPLTTPASQAAVRNAPEEIPVVFTIVTDPESAGLIGARGNVTGLSDAINISQYLAFVKRLYPSLSAAGLIYNELESNSVYLLQQIQAQSAFYGIDIITAAVTSEAEVPEAYAQIKDRGIGTIITTGDNTLASSLPSLSMLAFADSISVIGGSIDDVRAGAMASISIDYHQLAESTAELAYAVLQGVDPDDEPIRTFDMNVIALNQSSAERVGYIFSAALLAEAQYIFPD